MTDKAITASIELRQSDRSEKGDLTGPVEQESRWSKSGLVLHRGVRHDFLVRLATWGRERAFRERILQFAQLRPGQTVLDVGCGTGSLAIAAQQHVGTTGSVHGIDASPDMIARARKKARSAGVEIQFEKAFAQKLPFADAQFDRLVTTVTLHHLPRPARRECAREMRRVVKPGGYVLAVDFEKVPHGERGPVARFHRHGHVSSGEIATLLNEAELHVVESGAVETKSMHLALATTPGRSCERGNAVLDSIQ